MRLARKVLRASFPPSSIILICASLQLSIDTERTKDVSTPSDLCEDHDGKPRDPEVNGTQPASRHPPCLHRSSPQTLTVPAQRARARTGSAAALSSWETLCLRSPPALPSRPKRTHRCTPEQSRHTNTPLFTEAHWGLLCLSSSVIEPLFCLISLVPARASVDARLAAEDATSKAASPKREKDACNNPTVSVSSPS